MRPRLNQKNLRFGPGVVVEADVAEDTGSRHRNCRLRRLPQRRGSRALPEGAVAPVAPWRTLTKVVYQPYRCERHEVFPCVGRRCREASAISCVGVKVRGCRSKSPDVKMEIVLPARAGKREEVKTRSRRTSPEGNGGKTAAARTLRRDTASNGLVAVRRAVRQSMSVRFTALLHHMAFGTRG